MAKVTMPAGETGLIQFDNVADPFGPAQPAEVRNRYQWTLQFGPTANPAGGIVGTTLSNLTGLGNSNSVGFYVKSTDIPRATIETQVINQYNIRRNINTHVSYDPIQMTFYDTIDNSFLLYLKNYLNFKFMNWENAPNVRSPFQLGSGYAAEFGPKAFATGFNGGGVGNTIGLGDQSVADTLNDNFCSYFTITKEMKSSSTQSDIPVYTAMGDATGVTQTVDTAPADKSQQFTVYNPKIIELSQDKLDYADGNSPLMWTILWRYESFDFSGPQTPGWTSGQGVISDVARTGLEVGRNIGTFFTDTYRRLF
jgi:hypothetical protein